MVPERDGKGRFITPNGTGGDEQPPEPPLSPLAQAIARFERAKLQGRELHQLANDMHRAHPEARDWRPEEERLAHAFFHGKITAACSTLRRFEAAIALGREPEALGLLPEFENAAFAALVLIEWKELDKQLINLAYAGNRLSNPPPLQPMEYWRKVAFNFGWSGEETALIEIELMRDNSYTLKQLDQFGFTTNTDRKVNRLRMRSDAAPKEDPWRQKWFEKLPPIQGQR
jgi:hypothetical protein